MGVHIVMYFYYMMSAMGAQYQKYLWWKQHLTTLQMIQFVGIMTHGFQLVFYDDCDFPWQFSYYIGAHAVLFFVLFSQFYMPTTSGRVLLLLLQPSRRRMLVMAMPRKMASMKSTTTMSKKKSLPNLCNI